MFIWPSEVTIQIFECHVQYPYLLLPFSEISLLTGNLKHSRSFFNSSEYCKLRTFLALLCISNIVIKKSNSFLCESPWILLWLQFISELFYIIVPYKKYYILPCVYCSVSLIKTGKVSLIFVLPVSSKIIWHTLMISGTVYNCLLMNIVVIVNLKTATKYLLVPCFSLVQQTSVPFNIFGIKMNSFF